MSIRDSFPQGKYLWGTGAEESICGQRLVVTAVERSADHAGALLFNCTKRVGHPGSHCAEVDGLKGAPEWVQVWWPGPDSSTHPPEGTFAPDEDDESGS